MSKICDANPEKFNLVTPGTNLPIIPKKVMRADKPDYLMVFIWHFRKEVLIDEYKYIMINDNIEQCANEIIKIIADERS